MRRENDLSRRSGAERKTTVLLCLLVLAAVAGLIWLVAPKRFLRGTDPSKVAQITVFNGTTGKGFTVDEPDEIAYIVKSFQNTAMKRSGLSLGRMGYMYRITFWNEDGRALVTLILNGESTLRKDPFFYEAENGGLCYEYLQELEKTAE